MEIIELASEKPKPEFSFKEARASGRIIFETQDLVLGYGTPLSRPITKRLERGQKVAVVGTNGIGKTTFLKSVLGLIPPCSGRAELGSYLETGYFEQEIPPSDNTCLEELWQYFPSMSNGEDSGHARKMRTDRQAYRKQVAFFRAENRRKYGCAA